MNYSLFLKILLVLAIISTVCICCLKPQMHSSVFVYDSNYKIVEEPHQTTEVTTTSNVEEKVDAPIQEVNVDEKKQERVDTTDVQDEVQQVQKTTSAPVKTETKKVSTPKTETKQTKTVSNPNTKTLTEQQEEIQWNIWRSNLANKILRDLNLPSLIPHGTVFEYSFEVDAYGKVSNVQTWSRNPQYTPYAIQYIAPLIRGYQGTSILNFPSGTKRFTTTVTGKFKCSNQAVFTTPNNFNDTEVIKK